ncbi:MAG: type II toxin-antitoxin system HicA family toxin [Ignavibacteriales bacterium]|nr:MAG: type II toxin-antitoxin system HicA family toxin [Ignavibacteriales bacterium]
MKMPRDISSDHLIKVLLKLEYSITRQKGSHLRLSKRYIDGEHHITLPNHNPIKIGTLNNILNELSLKTKLSKEDLIKLILE